MQAPQIEIDFTTPSPINRRKLSGQNARLYEHLSAGHRIHCMHPSMSALRIGYLNSRISDLKNKFNVDVKSRYIDVDFDGEKTTVKEYWIETN